MHNSKPVIHLHLSNKSFEIAQLGTLYTQRNLFEILMNETEIRLYLPFSD